MTAIKICGITRQPDAETAVDLGVQALGFILWSGSPRQTTVDTVAQIVPALPPFVTPVGVFVRPSSEEVERAVAAGIRVAQIHGGRWLGNSSIRVLPAVRFAEGDELDPDVPDEIAVILDAYHPQLHGGTGRTADWDRAARLARTRPLVLAGGLSPDNVGEAVRKVRPYAVDVASGVEARPGIKDAELMKRFVHAVRLADRDETAREGRW